MSRRRSQGRRSQRRRRNLAAEPASIDPRVLNVFHRQAVGPKFHYLTKPEWTHAWVHGGDIPLYKASKHRSDERRATFTPDENLTDESTIDPRLLEPLVEFGDDVQYGYVRDVRVGDQHIFEGVVTRSTYDGLVLCLSNSYSRRTGERLGKRACVRVSDVDELKAILDEQIGVESSADTCKYVGNHYRDVFIKSTADAWQDEYRIYWPDQEERHVVLPAGVAEIVEVW